MSETVKKETSEIEVIDSMTDGEILSKFGVFYHMDVMTKASAPLEGLQGEEFKAALSILTNSIYKKFTPKDYYDQLSTGVKKDIKIDIIEELNNSKIDLKKKYIKLNDKGKTSPAIKTAEKIESIELLIESLKTKSKK